MPQLSLFECALPLHVPFVTALRRVTTARDVLLVLEDDSGRRGLGSAPPTLPLTGETTGTLLAFARDTVVPFLQGRQLPRSVEEVRALRQELDKLAAYNTCGKGALETALLDLLARTQNTPLHTLLASSPLVSQSPRGFATDVTLSIDAPEAMALRLHALARQGFPSFKVKLSGDASLDALRVDALAKACQALSLSSLRLRLDANEAFKVEEAIRFFQSMEDAYGTLIECVEQPVARDNWKGLKAVAKALRTPVYADEAAMSLAQCRFLVEQEACDGVVVKLAKAGGPLGFLDWCDVCAEAGVGVLASCMLECQASLMAAFHASTAFLQNHPAYARGERPFLADLDGALLLAASPFLAHEGLVFEQGLLRFSENNAQAAGLGLTVDTGAFIAVSETPLLREAGCYLLSPVGT
ncbi:MAG: hypothetical protein IOD12_13065 [Silvanigrellales bacterium]|nr:hypothetical protein [Silvanigrellales bacterium]